MKEYCGIRINGYNGELKLLDLEEIDYAVEDMKKYSSEFTYAEWSDRDGVCKEVAKVTDIKVWLLPTI